MEIVEGKICKMFWAKEIREKMTMEVIIIIAIKE
jgi:hypothetical protein